MGAHVVGLIVGIIFGACLVLAGLSEPDRIIRSLKLKDFHVINTIIVFLLVSLIGTWIITKIGTVEINIKPITVITLLIGGLFVGAGLGLTGYSPCTGLVAAATGRIDAATTVIGMFIGAHAYVIFYPSIISPLENIYNYGRVTLPQITNTSAATWIIPSCVIGFFVLFMTRIKNIRDRGQAKKRNNSEYVLNEDYSEKHSTKSIPKEEDFQFKVGFIEAAQTFGIWKNLLFFIIVICLLMLQISFWLVNRGFLETNSKMPFDLTYEHISILINISNSLLVIAAGLYVLTIFFCLSASFGASLGGLRYISRAFFSSLFAFILLLPWQIVLDSTVQGVIYTPAELVKYNSFDSSQFFNAALLYLRFVGYWAFVTFLIIRSQIYSYKWTKSVHSKIEQII